jgi:hypothetical protein
MIFLASTAGSVLAADDRACSQQERANKTLSEKLDQTAGVICPPDVDPAIKVPATAASWGHVQTLWINWSLSLKTNTAISSPSYRLRLSSFATI